LKHQLPNLREPMTRRFEVFTHEHRLMRAVADEPRRTGGRNCAAPVEVPPRRFVPTGQGAVHGSDERCEPAAAAVRFMWQMGS